MSKHPNNWDLWLLAFLIQVKQEYQKPAAPDPCSTCGTPSEAGAVDTSWYQLRLQAPLLEQSSIPPDFRRRSWKILQYRFIFCSSWKNANIWSESHEYHGLILKAPLYLHHRLTSELRLDHLEWYKYCRNLVRAPWTCLGRRVAMVGCCWPLLARSYSDSIASGTSFQLLSISATIELRQFRRFCFSVSAKVKYQYVTNDEDRRPQWSCTWSITVELRRRQSQVTSGIV